MVMYVQIYVQNHSDTIFKQTVHHKPKKLNWYMVMVQIYVQNHKHSDTIFKQTEHHKPIMLNCSSYVSTK